MGDEGHREEERRRVLVVDDDGLGRKALATSLKRRGWGVVQAEHGRSALELLEKTAVDLIVTDLDMPVMDGLALVEALRAAGSSLPVLLVTAFTEVANVVKAMRAGADDVLAKPYDLATLLFRMEKAVEFRRLLRENAELSAEGATGFVVGSCPAMRSLMDRARAAAKTSAPILIMGESGTGKELLARFVHRSSDRAGGPFVAVFCGALPEGLVESQLFGHVKGAFTGANEDRGGLIDAAGGGTLFFDEVGELDLEIQVKLLRLLQEREYRPVGSDRILRTDARILAATNRDLEAEIRRGAFREDLYYRLNVVPLHLPPLSARMDDLGEFVAAFARRAATEYGKELPVFDGEALRVLASLPWPGNLRQLENAVRRLVIFAKGPVGAEELAAIGLSAPGEATPTASAGARAPGAWGDERREALDRFERDYLDRLLRHVGGNVSEAARRSGKDRRDLHRLLSKWQIDASRYRVEKNGELE